MAFISLLPVAQLLSERCSFVSLIWLQQNVQHATEVFPPLSMNTNNKNNYNIGTLPIFFRVQIGL